MVPTREARTREGGVAAASPVSSLVPEWRRRRSKRRGSQNAWAWRRASPETQPGPSLLLGTALVAPSPSGAWRARVCFPTHALHALFTCGLQPFLLFIYLFMRARLRHPGFPGGPPYKH